MLNPACVTLALVLPQHILTNPLHAPRRQSPLAALFALDTCFVDESEIARQPTSPFPLISPQRPRRHNPIPPAFPPTFPHLSENSLSIPLRIAVQGMGVVSPSRSGILSGGRYVLLHEQRIIEVDLCCMSVLFSCMAFRSSSVHLYPSDVPVYPRSCSSAGSNAPSRSS